MSGRQFPFFQKASGTGRNGKCRAFLLRGKKIRVIALIVMLPGVLEAAVLSEPFRPYQPGSVFNLSRYLPWNHEAPEIVRYPTGCSVNRLADFALQSIFPKTRGGFSEVFRTECVRHDLCYRHGYYTYQFTKEDCDNEFADGLRSRCVRDFQGDELVECDRVAELLILAARKFGHLSYHADDYPFRDYGYYYEYLEDRAGQFALLWRLLDGNSKRYQALYRRKVNSNFPLPSSGITRRLLLEFFRKKISLHQLTNRLKGSWREAIPDLQEKY
ncbi:MAG: hypothetical protein ACU843_04225 [Gammaproteobacteria bacterium]